MVRRRDLVRMFVLDQISDDYECLHQITKQVADLSSRCAFTIELDEILAALGDLISGGLARAYRFSPKVEGIDGTPPIEEIGSPDAPGIDDVYFRVTEKGMQLQLSDYPDWPFDDHNVLRPDWKPPEK